MSVTQSGFNPVHHKANWNIQVPSHSNQSASESQPDSKPLRGRFAPSPTGPLHFGSLVVAIGSWLEARSRRGKWLLRMEDLDRPREIPGAADAVLRALEACGLEWDGALMFQSQRTEAYADAMAMLQRRDLVYPCACTRREIADSVIDASLPGLEVVYPGTCRNGLAAGRSPRAWRVRTGDECNEFIDRVQGRHAQLLPLDVGDFVVRRADGLFAYQLAVVVDDAAQGISDVVRGADLLSSTLRQIHLQELLGLPVPDYAHLPVAINARFEKLSKQTLATPIPIDAPAPWMLSALRFLGHAPPPDLGRNLLSAPPREILAWAVAHWDLARVPRVRAVAAPDPINVNERASSRSLSSGPAQP